MAISKITLNGVTQMDVTQKTVTAGTMLNGTTALKNDGTDITGNIASKSSSDLTVSGATVTAPAGNYASAASKTIPNADVTVGDPSFAYTTESGARKWGFGYSAFTESAGYIGEGQFGVHSYKFNAIAANTTINPSASPQTVGGANWIMEEALTVKAVKITVLEDALVYSSPISRTNLGVTFDFNTDKSCYAHGKSTSTATGQYYINQSAMPSYIQKGVEYTVEYSSPNIFFQIWDYSGGTLTKLLETKTNTTFTFPTTMTGVLIRLAVANGVTVDETVHPRLYLPRTTGLSGADILEGIILEIGDVDDSDRILSVTGTATRA